MDEATRRRLDEISRAKAALDAEERALIRDSLIAEMQADMLRIAGVPKSGRLQAMREQSTVYRAKMEAPPTAVLSKSAKTSATMTRSKAPFSIAVVLKGISIPEWVDAENKRAKEERTPRVTVEAARSWVKKPGHGGRPIPRYWADRIETSMGIAAIAANWPNGIRE